MLEAAQNVDSVNTSGKAGKELGNFGMMTQDLMKIAPYSMITELMKETLQCSGCREALMTQSSSESQARLKNLDEFLSVTQEFDKCFEAQNNDNPNGEGTRLVDFLTDLALASDLDNLEESSSQTTLMMLHTVKGLEFPAVLPMDSEEGVFLLSCAMLEESELEEEWCLVYAGTTRTEETLFLTDTYSRTLYGYI